VARDEGRIMEIYYTEHTLQRMARIAATA